MTVRARGVAGLAIMLAGADGSAAAIVPVPATALSQSVRVPTELLPADEANQYVFPQHAAGPGSALLAFGAAHAQAVGGSGVRADLDGSTISFHYVHSVPSATSTGISVPVYRLGWARRAAGLRIGAAYSWSVRGDRERDIRIESSLLSERALKTRTEFRTVSQHRVSIGLGWGEGDATVDVVTDLVRDRLDHRNSEETESLVGPYVRTLTQYRTDLTGDLRPGVTVRARAPLGSRLRVLAFGAWREISFEITRTRRSEFHDSDSDRVEELSTSDHDDGRVWVGGATVELGNDWRWIASVFRESRHEPWRWEPRQDLVDRARDEVDELRVGVATVFPFGRSTTLRAGISMIDRRETRTEQVVLPDRTRTLDRPLDRVSHEWGWGATHSFGPLDLVGSMAGNLPLGDLFFLLDLRARF